MKRVAGFLASIVVAVGLLVSPAVAHCPEGNVVEQWEILYGENSSSAWTPISYPQGENSSVWEGWWRISEDG